MNKIPEDLKYAATHEWARANNDGTITVGIADYAQNQLGDLVFVETPEVGRKVNAAEACAVVESVKAASDIYSPVAGEVVEVNEALADTPELINQDPYGEGWIFRLRSEQSLDELMDADAYSELVAEQSS